MRGRGGESVSDTAAGYACYCIDLPATWTATGRFPCRLTGSLEQLTAFVEVLFAGRGGTGDEIVRTNGQSGHQTTSDGQSEIADF